jgi:hypothetical protein
VQDISRVGFAVGTGLGVGTGVTVGTGVGEGVGVGVANGNCSGVKAGLPLFGTVTVEAAAKDMKHESNRTIVIKLSIFCVMEHSTACLCQYPSGDIE